MRDLAGFMGTETPEEDLLDNKGRIGLYVTGPQSKFNLTTGKLVISLVGEAFVLAEQDVSVIYEDSDDKGRKRAKLISNNVLKEAQFNMKGWKVYSGEVRYAVLRHYPPVPVLFMPEARDRFLSKGASYFTEYDKSNGTAQISRFARYTAGHAVFDEAVMSLPAGRYMAAKVGESLKVGEGTRKTAVNYTVIKPGKYNVTDIEERKLLNEVYNFPEDTTIDALKQIMSTLAKFAELKAAETETVLGVPSFDSFKMDRILDIQGLEDFLNDA